MIFYKFYTVTITYIHNNLLYLAEIFIFSNETSSVWTVIFYLRALSQQQYLLVVLVVHENHVSAQFQSWISWSSCPTFYLKLCWWECSGNVYEEHVSRVTCNVSPLELTVHHWQECSNTTTRWFTWYKDNDFWLFLTLEYASVWLWRWRFFMSRVNKLKIFYMIDFTFTKLIRNAKV